MDSLIQYNNAVNAIKTAILQGQYEAAKGVNRIQLALYFAIGKYLSQHTRKGVWGEGALASISEQLRKELPGLRGFSETQLRDMRRFYEAWDMLDSNSAVATAELQNSENQIDIFHTLSISNIPDFPVEDFFKVPFTHHSAIISGPKETSARFYYIHRTVEEHLSVKKLRQLIKEDAYHSQGRNQYRLEIYGVEQFPDLLFFNRELNAMVCIELKLGEFKTSYLGQLFGYLQILDDKVRKPHDLKNAAFGLLCQCLHIPTVKPVTARKCLQATDHVLTL